MALVSSLLCAPVLVVGGEGYSGPGRNSFIRKNTNEFKYYFKIIVNELKQSF